MDTLTIGQVAARAGVGVETVRFYERRGLIRQPPRLGLGYRRYPEGTVLQISFIRHAKELGFTLGEIQELLALRVHPKRSCGPVRRKAEAKVLEVDEKLKGLRRLRKTLQKLVRACDERKPTSECPILDALEESSGAGTSSAHGRRSNRYGTLAVRQEEDE